MSEGIVQDETIKTNRDEDDVWVKYYLPVPHSTDMIEVLVTDYGKVNVNRYPSNPLDRRKHPKINAMNPHHGVDIVYGI